MNPKPIARILALLIVIHALGCGKEEQSAEQAPPLVRFFDRIAESDSEMSTDMTAFREHLTDKWTLAENNSERGAFSCPVGFCPSPSGWGTLEFAGNSLPRKTPPENSPVTEPSWDIAFGEFLYPLGENAKGNWLQTGRHLTISLELQHSDPTPLPCLLYLTVRAERVADTYPILKVLIDNRLVYRSVISHPDNRVHVVPFEYGAAAVNLRMEAERHVLSHPVMGEKKKAVGVIVREIRIRENATLKVFLPPGKVNWFQDKMLSGQSDFAWIEPNYRSFSEIEKTLTETPVAEFEKQCVAHILEGNTAFGSLALRGVKMRGPSHFGFPADFQPGDSVSFSVGLSADIGNYVFAKVTSRLAEQDNKEKILLEQLLTQDPLDPKPFVKSLAVKIPDDVKGKGSLHFSFGPTPGGAQVQKDPRESIPSATYIFANPTLSPKSKQGEAKLPNAILICIDTLRADHLSCYGHEYLTSPYMDDFAKRNLRFSLAWSPSNWTLPSHRAFLNGLPVGQQSANVEDKKVILNVPNLAQEMKRMGYVTAAFTDGGYVSSDYGMDPGFDLFDGRGERLKNIYPRVEQWLRTCGKEAPFFLFFHFFDVHAVYGSSKVNLERFFNECGCEMDPEIVATIGEVEFNLKDNNTHVDNKLLHHMLHLYDADIHYADEYMERLFELLKELKLYENTSLMITSDHGEEFGDHGGWHHGRQLYAELVNVPLIVKLPRSRHRKGVCDIPVSCLDIAPTLVSLAGGKAPEEWYGDSLLDILANPETYKSRRVISEFISTLRGREIYKFAAFETGMKYIGTFCRRGPKTPDPNWGYYQGEQDELYFTRIDPTEQVDLGSFYPDITQSFRGSVEKTIDQFENANVAQLAQEDVTVSREVLDTLKDLGYIQ